MKFQQAALVAALAAAGSAQFSLGSLLTTFTFNATANVTDIPDTLWESPFIYPSPQGGRTQDEQWAAAYEKARAFVSKLSLLEKVNLTSGIGNAGACVGMTGDIPSQDFQGICFQDGPLGVRPSDMVTGHPANIAAGATFNKRLVHARSRAIGSEFKGKGIDVGLGPVVGPLGFYPSSGRQWEGFGADPYLAGALGAEAVLGMQEAGVMANAKHFVVNEQETYRKTINELVNDRALHEIYVWPFANLIQAGVGSVMCSYNLLNGTFGCENSYVLNHILKDELGFQGFVVSDWDGTHSGIRAATSGLDMNMPGEADHFASNLTAAVFNGTVPMERLDDMATRVMAAFYKTNLDVIRPERGPPNYNTWTLATVGPQYPGVFYGEPAVLNKHADVRSEFNYKAAYTTSLESVVLLKNVNNTLPLMTQNKRPPAKISVIGAAARPATGGGQCTVAGCIVADGATQLGWGSGATAYPYLISPAEGVTTRARTLEGVALDYNFAVDPLKDMSFVRTATNSDVNLVFALANGGEGVDRINTTIQLNGDAQILAAASMNANNVVVVSAVGAVDMSPWIDHPNITAVLFAPPGGQDAGTVIAELLFGDKNPSGRLPFTLAKQNSDFFQVGATNVTMSEYPQDFQINKGDIYLDYRRFDKYNIEPLYEFGYGLSYSEFTFSNLQVQEVAKPAEHLPPPPALNPVYQLDQVPLPTEEELVIPAEIQRIPNLPYSWVNSSDQLHTEGGYQFPEGYSTVQKNDSSLAGGASGGNPALWQVSYKVQAILTNKGAYQGKYVAQMYIGFPDTAEFPAAPKQLRGFEKVDLQPGQSTSVEFDILWRDLSVWDVKTASWIVQPGEYQIYVGSSSRKLELQGAITI